MKARPLATSCNQPSSCPILTADNLELLHHLISTHVPPCQNEILTLFPAFQINSFHVLFIVVFIMCVTLNSVWFLYFIDHLGTFGSICYHGLHLLTHLTYLMLLFHYQFPTVAFTDFGIAMFAQGKSFFVLLRAIIYIYQKLSNYLAQLTLTLPNSLCFLQYAAEHVLKAAPNHVNSSKWLEVQYINCKHPPTKNFSKAKVLPLFLYMYSLPQLPTHLLSLSHWSLASEVSTK